MNKLLFIAVLGIICFIYVACDEKKNTNTVIPTNYTPGIKQNNVLPDTKISESEPEPEPKRDPVPMQEWQQCVNCFGSGQCGYCYGQGHNYNMYGEDQDCPVCTDGRCPRCAGQGGHYEIVYR